MTGEMLKGWPEGTKKIKHENGVEEIILPEAVDMGKFSREEIEQNVEKSVGKTSTDRNIHFSEGVFNRKLSFIKEDEKQFKHFKTKVPRRQHQIRKNIHDQRKFKSVQEQISA